MPQTAAEPLRGLLERLKAVHGTNGQYVARCPAHDDRTPSLSVTAATDGRVLLYCHVGCTSEAICTAVGLQLRDLFPQDLPRPKPRRPTDAESRVVEEYNYTDESGAVLFQVTRHEPKAFRQRRPNGRGGWNHFTRDVRRVPYKLPVLIEAVALSKQIIVVEGEKSADRLHSLGITATCSSGGAGKWRAEYNEHFRGADVDILPDNDVTGQRHAEQVASALAGIARRVRIVTLPGLPEKGDVVDWLDNGGTLDELQRLAESTPEWSAPVTTATTLQERGASARRIIIYDDDELLALPDPEWDVPGIIARNSLVQMHGPYGAYKSFIALDLAAHRQLGLQWHGIELRQGPVFYLVAEGAVGMRLRVRGWREYANVGRLGLRLIPQPVYLNDPTEVEQLLEAMAERLAEGAEPWLIVDTRTRCLIGNENSTEDVSAFVRGCDRIRQELGATVIVLHHPGWANEDRGRGAYDFDASCDTIIRVEKDAERVTLTCTKQKDGPEFGPMAFEAIPVAKTLVFSAVELTSGKLTGQRLQILRELHQNSTELGWSYKAWLTATTLKSSSFNKAREWLTANSYVKSSGGKWKITDAGRLALGDPLHRCSTVTPLPPDSRSEPLLHSARGTVVPGGGVARESGPPF